MSAWQTARVQPLSFPHLLQAPLINPILLSDGARYSLHATVLGSAHSDPEMQPVVQSALERARAFATVHIFLSKEVTLIKNLVWVESSPIYSLDSLIKDD